MSSVLVAHAAEQMETDGETFHRMITPDEVITIPVVGPYTAFRSRDHIPETTGHTQGGFRIKLVDDSRLNGQTPIDLAADELEARELGADMTPKLGFILRCLRIGIQRGLIDPAFDIPDTGGAKCVLSLPRSSHKGGKLRYQALDSLVDNYFHGFATGDGFGPDMGVGPDDMKQVSQRLRRNELALDMYAGLEHHATNKPFGFPGRGCATGTLAIEALYETILQKDIDLPYDDRTIVLQGLGSAGGPAEEAIQELMAPDDYRVTGVADQNIGLVAKDRSKGIKMGVDYQIAGGGLIIDPNPDTTHYVPSETILYQKAGVKILAAMGGQVNRRNWKMVTSGTRVLGEIANLGVDADTALTIEKERPELEVVPVPLISAGGVIISLFERHKNMIERKLGREVTAGDTRHIITQLAIIGAEILIKECDQNKVGAFTGAYKIGLSEQYEPNSPKTKSLQAVSAA